jgi:hypothetical protein
LRKRKKFLIITMASTKVQKKAARPLREKEEAKVKVTEVVTEEDKGEIKVATGLEVAERLMLNAEVVATTVVEVASHLMKMMMDLPWSRKTRSSSNAEITTGEDTEKIEVATVVKEEVREVTEAVTDKSVAAEEIVQEKNAEAEVKVAEAIEVDR